jgi:DNA polymerase kappa
MSTKKFDMDFFGAAARRKPAQYSTIGSTREQEISAEEAFEKAAREELQDEMHDLETEESLTPANAENTPDQLLYWDCPVCSMPQLADDRKFNDHVDYCLSKQTIKEAVQGGSPQPELEPAPASTRKRKTVAREVLDPRQKRLFFT